MSVWNQMAHDGGYRGDEARQVAAMLEQEERERFERAYDERAREQDGAEKTREAPDPGQHIPF